jgi:hypothetical protein
MVSAVQIDPAKTDEGVIGVADKLPGQGPGARSAKPLVVHAK